MHSVLVVEGARRILSFLLKLWIFQELEAPLHLLLLRYLFLLTLLQSDSTLLSCHFTIAEGADGRYLTDVLQGLKR